MLVPLCWGAPYANVAEVEAWAAFPFSSYLFGHLLILLGSWLDEFYDWSRRHALNAQIASVRCAVESVNSPHADNLMSNSNENRLGRSERRLTTASRPNLSLVKPIAIGFGVSLIGLLIAFLVKGEPELHKQLISASLTLLFGACFGGIVKMLLDQAVAEKRRRDDAAAFVANVLADLKKVYDHVERARLLIPAHQSAKTYGDEMREDVTAGVVQLRNVIRALQGRVAGVPVGLQECVRPEVEKMKRYLLELMDEFSDEYKHLPHYQQCCPPCLTDPPGGPTMTDAIALRPRAAG
jgi:hypothetical protein